MPVLLTPILSWLGSLLGGPFAKAAVQAYQAKLTSENSSETIAATLAARELAVEQREAELNNSLQIADEGHWYTACIRPLFAAPFILYNLKLIVWDKMLARGVTDALSADLLALEGKVIMFYFAGRSAEKVAAILKRK